MALQAEHIDLAALQQARIRRTMGECGRRRSLRSSLRVLKDERSRLVCMAAKANLILCSGRTQPARHEPAMRIMTIAARHQALVHAMVNGFGELWFDFEVAAVTQHWLGHHQKSTFHFGMVCRMAVNAAYVIF